VKRTPIPVLAAACAALLVAGCGSSNKEESTQAQTPATQTTTQTGKLQNEPTGGASAEGGGSTLQLAADPSGQLKFDKSSLTAKAGKVTLDMANPSTVPHAVAVRGNGIDKDGKVAQTKGESSTVTVDLKPGTYTFYCPVDQHEQSGMKGTLTVK
jgi:plastocyanin